MGRKRIERAGIEGADLADAEAVGQSEVPSGNGSPDRPVSEVHVSPKSERISWKSCIPRLDEYAKQFYPDLIVKAIVPCDEADDVYFGLFAGYPVEKGAEFKFLLNTGKWTA